MLTVAVALLLAVTFPQASVTRAVVVEPGETPAPLAGPVADPLVSYDLEFNRLGPGQGVTGWIAPEGSWFDPAAPDAYPENSPR